MKLRKLENLEDKKPVVDIDTMNFDQLIKSSLIYYDVFRVS